MSVSMSPAASIGLAGRASAGAYRRLDEARQRQDSHYERAFDALGFRTWTCRHAGL
jgi:hypothetical protein